MPGYWTDKEERQYQHVKEGYGDDPRAEEIAARTVNKLRGKRKRIKKNLKLYLRAPRKPGPEEHLDPRAAKVMATL